MKRDANKKNYGDGSVLVVALVVCAIGTLGVLATVSVIGARSLQAEAHLDGLDRRVKFNNSNALGREVIYRNYLADDVVLDSETTFQAGSWGTVKVGVFDNAALSFSDAARTHPTGAAPIRAFSKDVEVKLNDGANDHVVQFQMRSYNPALAGDLLSVHPTTETTTEAMRVAGDLKVKGRAVFWPATYYQDVSSTVRSEEVIAPVANAPKLVLEDPDGNPVKPSNYVGYSQTMGKVGSGNNFGGELDIVDNPATGVNSYFQRLTALGGAVSAYGSVELTDGLGPATVSPKPDDATLLAAIADPELSEAAIVGLLASSSPLSSSVMLASLTRNPAISDSYLLPLLNSQAPLPDDVIIAISDPSGSMSPATRKQLLKNTGYSYICNGNGTVTVNLQSSYLPNLLLQNVNHLILSGQDDSVVAEAAKLLQPRAIAVKNSDNVFLPVVELDGATNQRRIALAISQTGVLDGADLTDHAGNPSALGTNQTSFLFVGSTPFTQWRMITEMEGVSSNWDVTGVSSATVFGGIRTDHSIRITGGTLTLERETETEFIESLVSRNAWVETYK